MKDVQPVEQPPARPLHARLLRAVGHAGELAGIREFVAPPNRIKWLGQKVDPRKDQITDSDRPQVRVDFGDPFAEPDQLTARIYCGAAGTSWRRRDMQQIDRLGKNGLGGSIAPVLWAISFLCWDTGRRSRH